MTEFEFLDKQFRRLNEARRLDAHHTPKPVKVGRKMVTPFSPFKTAELMMSGAIEDYLTLTRKEGK